MYRLRKETKPKKEKKPKFLYRYFCDACTGIAFMGSNPIKGVHKTCQICGKKFVTKVENFISRKKK